jgi:fumarate reductase flavoprotein subunit/urocanate reductase
MQENRSGGTRRDFLKAGIGAAMAAGTLALAGCSGTAAQNAAGGGKDSGAPAWGEETDVLVLGGGMGGFFAAYFAKERGAKVILVEAAPEVGGTALISTGWIHTWDIQTTADVLKKMPLANPKLITRFIESWIPLREWLNDGVVPVTPIDMPSPVYSPQVLGAGFSNSKPELIEFFTAGVDVRTSTRAIDLAVDADGAVLGAIVRGADGKKTAIKAKNTIIATGSYQANREMVERSLGRWADQAIIRATPYNTGEGIAMAVRAGAAMSAGCGHFYGHLTPWPAIIPQTLDEYDKADKAKINTLCSMVQSISVEGLAINLDGERYSDESPVPYAGDNYLANDTAAQRTGHVFIVADSAKDHETNYKTLRDANAVVLEADTIEGLAEQMAGYGVTKERFLNTVAQYREAAAAGKTMELPVPKSPMQTGYLTMMDTPPYYAIQAAPGISGFYGGLKINEDGQVLGYDDRPITGLYAVPMAAGGVYYKEYAGALALCATFGKIAGESAAS